MTPNSALPADLSTPEVVDRDTWKSGVEELRTREKAHTREGDAIAAARRRLPMTEVDASPPGDAFYPHYPVDEWAVVRRESGEGCEWLWLERMDPAA